MRDNPGPRHVLNFREAGRFKAYFVKVHGRNYPGPEDQGLRSLVSALQARGSLSRDDLRLLHRVASLAALGALGRLRLSSLITDILKGLEPKQNTKTAREQKASTRTTEVDFNLLGGLEQRLKPCNHRNPHEALSRQHCGQTLRPLKLKWRVSKPESLVKKLINCDQKAALSPLNLWTRQTFMQTRNTEARTPHPNL